MSTSSYDLMRHIEEPDHEQVAAAIERSIDPTPEEIAERAAQIQSGWSDRERQSRIACGRRGAIVHRTWFETGTHRLP